MIKVVVRVKEQVADVFRKGELIRTFQVSTGKNGLGSERGSLKTPMGKLRVAQKVGAGHPIGTVFKERVPTGEIWSADGPPVDQDLITTRILWLEGLEPHNANTWERMVYFHGTNQEHLIGTPASHGCIRLTNRDVLEFFDLVPEGAEVQVIG